LANSGGWGAYCPCALGILIKKGFKLEREVKLV